MEPEKQQPESPRPRPSLGKILLWMTVFYLVFSFLLGGLANRGGMEGDRFIIHLKEKAALSMIDSTTPVKMVESEECSIRGNVVCVRLVGRLVYIPLSNVSYVEVYSDDNLQGR